MRNKKISLALIIEIIALFILISTHFICFFYLQGGILNPIPNFFSAIPPLFFYLILRFFAPPLFAGLFVSMALVILSIANRVKFLTTNESLSWSDIWSLGTTKELISKYMTASTILFLIGCVVLLILAGWFSYLYKNKNSQNRKFLILQVFFTLVLLPLTFHSYYLRIDNGIIQKRIEKIALEWNIIYRPESWMANIKMNGLPMHLIQTSVRRIPKNASELEKKLYFDWKFSTTISERPKQIIYILCESCWYDEQNFSELFSPLLSKGFVPFRGVAPVFGGGTANSTFEMLTGLPAKTKFLDGVIYREYASNIKMNADALPHNLREEGYLTYSIQTALKNSWKADIVEPKLGFEKFISMTDMPQYLKSDYVKYILFGDKILFHTALAIARLHPNENLFLHLANMQTHGPYEKNQDEGEKSYQKKISDFMPYLLEFLDEFEKIAPHALIVIYGDHKPYLNNFFSSKNIFHEESPWEKTGDVPIWIKAPIQQVELKQLVNTWNGLPLFCIASEMNAKFIGATVPAFNFNHNKICPMYSANGYLKSASIEPEWLYTLSLFTGKEFPLQLQ